MDIKEIVELLEHFDASKATKLQLKSGDTELTLESAPAPLVYAQPVELTGQSQPVSTGKVTVVQPAAETGIQNTSKNRGEESVAEPAGAAENNVSGTPVKAPLVGTFYCAPSPEEKPFVTVGQSVKKGEVVAIIEAMKLMNEITAPADGVVKTVLAENGNMVEYGEVLMVLE